MVDLPESLLPAWYVAFHNSQQPQWWARFLKPGFQHVFAFAWDERGGRWVIVNYGLEASYVRALDANEIAAVWANLAAMEATVVLARVECAPRRIPRLLASCVTNVAALLGLPGVCALTPFALYRTLLKRNAVTVMREHAHG